MHPVAFTLDSRKGSGTDIMATPFRQDPMIDRLPTFADKSYYFILSNVVPSTIYQIGIWVPTLAGKPAPFEEAMTHVG